MRKGTNERENEKGNERKREWERKQTKERMRKGNEQKREWERGTNKTENEKANERENEWERESEKGEWEREQKREWDRERNREWVRVNWECQILRERERERDCKKDTSVQKKIWKNLETWTFRILTSWKLGNLLKLVEVGEAARARRVLKVSWKWCLL